MLEDRQGDDGRKKIIGYVFLGVIAVLLTAAAIASNGLYGLVLLSILAALVYLLSIALSFGLRLVGFFTDPAKRGYLPTPGFLAGIIVLSSWAYWFDGVSGIEAVLSAAIFALVTLRGKFERVRVAVLCIIGIGAILVGSSQHVVPTEPLALLYFLLSVFAAGAVLEALVLIASRRESKELVAVMSVFMALFTAIGVLVISLVLLRGGRFLSVVLVILSVGCYISSIFLTWAFGTMLRPQFQMLTDVALQLRALISLLGAACSGFVLITFAFAGLYAALFRKIPVSFTGLPTHPSFVDFWYFSATTAGTLGGEVVPYTPLAKLLSAVELLTGLSWVTIVFGAVSVTLRPRKMPEEPTSPSASAPSVVVSSPKVD